jgi:hypothetical protein
MNRDIETIRQVTLQGRSLRDFPYEAYDASGLRKLLMITLPYGVMIDSG